VGAIRAGLRHENPAIREGCCRLLDHLVDTDSMAQLICMADDPDARVRAAAFHALACDRCKGDTCAPGAGQVLEPALQHMATDPDAHARAMAAELVGKFVHTDGRAVTAWRRPAPRIRARPSGRRQAGSPPAAPSTNEPSHACPGYCVSTSSEVRGTGT
jgi:hypothetical protein